jgi:hypothetical protein
MYIDDIDGTRTKGLYKSVAKDILYNRDIDGSSPKFEKVFITSPSSIILD